ncbi:RNA polymerase-binding protein DksA [Pseudomonas sp. gcc21]|uniref:RNA polymerase-binding protein DksA n=1 Tax=Pseudomonas sp. gcc21 TaxID=2726989 RepID=UPI00145142EE|nr:RNA polymerase-binding protein DksA [Pseudomonas sp. gcc21]QJD59726.1 RNA polymerase-binding protein DksA [Pseudomonas sp. gcc21]
MSESVLTTEQLLAQPEDDYMNEGQLAFFQKLLQEQRAELQVRIDAEFQALREYEPGSDIADTGSAEEQRQWQLRLLEREKKLLDKIDQALDRIADGSYGWCAETGEPIGLKRLLLRPTATLSIEAKEREEEMERHLREA